MNHSRRLAFSSATLREAVSAHRCIAPRARVDPLSALPPEPSNILMTRSIGFALILLANAVAPEASAQRLPDSLPSAAYARAERFMYHKNAVRVYRDRIDARWLKDGYRF